MEFVIREHAPHFVCVRARVCARCRARAYYGFLNGHTRSKLITREPCYTADDTIKRNNRLQREYRDGP